MSFTNGVRHGWFTVRSECPHCGQPLPLNGPAMTEGCAHCLNEISLPTGMWAPVLDAFDDRHDTLAPGEQHADTFEEQGLRVRYEYGAAEPTCEKCGAPYPIADLAVGGERNFNCVQCGDPASTWSAAPWLTESVPSAKQIYSTHPGVAQAGSAVTLGSLAEAMRPVSMACPACGGGLRITAEDTRVVPCKYCESEVYLPDEVWRRLHPVKTVERFYVRFEGLSRAQRIAEAEAQRATRARAHVARVLATDAQMRAEKDRRQRVSREQAAQLVVFGKLTNIAWFAALGASGLLGVFASWAWLARTATPFSPLHGSGLLITVALGIASLGAVLVAMWAASRPVQKASGNGFEWILFVMWFWLPFVILMPVVGQVMALARVVILMRGKFGASTVTSGSNSTSYRQVRLEHGEGGPGALLFFCLATLWPLTVVGLAGGWAALWS